MTKTEIHLIRLERRQILRQSVKPAGMLYVLLFVRHLIASILCVTNGVVHNTSDINTSIILFCGGFMMMKRYRFYKYH